MLEKLDFMVRFWDLKARHEALAPLTSLERGELLSLTLEIGHLRHSMTDHRNVPGRFGYCSHGGITPSSS